jgi:4-amino-4-deoxy-L-arabinose transferase-like glycosyltransferase
MILVYALLGLFPWVFAAGFQFKHWSQRIKERDPSTIVLTLSFLAPLLLFLPAKSLLCTYVLPAAPAICVLLFSQFTPSARWLTFCKRYTIALITVASVGIIVCLSLPDILTVPVLRNLQKMTNAPSSLSAEKSRTQRNSTHRNAAS